MFRQNSHESPQLGESSSQLAHAVGQLVRKEMELARVEMAGQLRQGFTAAALLGAAAVSGGMALLLASLAAVAALSVVIPVWAGFVVVAAIFGGPAVLLATAGVGAAKKARPAPVETIASVKETIAWMTGRARRS